MLSQQRRPRLHITGVMGCVRRWLIRPIFPRKGLLQWGQAICGAEPGWEEEFSVSFLLCRFFSLSLMRLSSKVATPRFYKGTPGRTVHGGLFPGGIGNAALLKRCPQCFYSAASVFQVSVCLWTARRRIVFWEGGSRPCGGHGQPTRAESA